MDRNSDRASRPVVWPAVIAAAGMAIAALAVAGCGKSGPSHPGAALSGTVTINGQPIPADAQATVRFMPSGPAGQAPPVSAKIAGGRYEAKDVPLGKVNVVFFITRLTGREVVEDNVPGGTPYPERENLVPVKLRQGTPLEVTGDNNKQDFDLRG